MGSSSSSHIATTSCNVGAMITTQGGNSKTHIENINVGGSEKVLQIKEFNVPRLIHTYRGREAETAELTSLFFEKGNKKIVICGLPGFGKSELAKHFSKHCKNSGKVEKVIWINAEKKEDLEESFQNLSKSVGVSNLSGNSLIQYIYEQSEHFVKHTCMFIFDNGHNRQCIADYEPPDSHNYFLLITSREKDWGDDVTSFPLNPLTNQSALDVIESVLTVGFEEKDLNLYRQLADIVSRVPLGLQIVAAYIRVGQKTEGEKFCLKKYVNEMETSQDKYTKKIPRTADNTYQQSLYSAIKISLNRLENEEDYARDLALDMLFICSYLNPEYIYFSDLLEISDKFSGKFDCNRMLKAALKLVDNYSLINYSPDQIEISMHRIIQEILLFHLREFKSERRSPMIIKHPFYKKCLNFEESEYYEICLDFLLPNKFQHISSILKYADDNLTKFYKFYGKNKVFLTSEDYVELRLHIEDETSSNLIRYKTGLEVVLETLLISNCSAAMNIIFSRLDKDIKLNLLNKIITNKELQWNVKCLMCLLELHANFNEDDIIFILNLLNSEEIKITTNDAGKSLLHLFAGLHNANLVSLLITKYQMEVNQQDHRKRTPLHTLFSIVLNCNDINQRVTETAKQLTKYGASLSIKDSKNMTPLNYVINVNNYDLVELLLLDIEDMHYLQEVLVNTDNREFIDKMYLLHKAIIHNKIEMMKVLLKYGAKFENKDDELNTPMHVAAGNWNLQALEILIQYKSNVNIKNKNGHIPLLEFFEIAPQHVNINVNNVDKILEILKYKENESIRNNCGETGLHMLVKLNNANLVQLFLTKYHMNVNAQNYLGKTPLHTILYKARVHLHDHQKPDDDIRIIHELQKYGARLDIRDQYRKTPIQIAQEKNLDKLLGW